MQCSQLAHWCKDLQHPTLVVVILNIHKINSLVYSWVRLIAQFFFLKPKLTPFPPIQPSTINIALRDATYTASQSEVINTSAINDMIGPPNLFFPTWRVDGKIKEYELKRFMTFRSFMSQRIWYPSMFSQTSHNFLDYNALQISKHGYTLYFIHFILY